MTKVLPRKPKAKPPMPSAGVADSDRALFLDAIGDVRRISTDRVDARPPPPAAEPVQSRLDDLAVTR